MISIDYTELNTLTFTDTEQSKGWSSFYNYSPEWIQGIFEDTYTFKDGQIYKHYDGVGRNVFYGKSYNSRVVTVFNNNPFDIKIFQSINIEGNTPPAILKVDSLINDRDSKYSTELSDNDFVEKEGVWFAYLKRASNSDYSSKHVYGIGVVKEVDNSKINIENLDTSNISIGDFIYNSNMENVGEITGLDNSFIYYTPTTFVINEGDFVLGVKNSIIEGNSLRGYVAIVDFTYPNNDRIELFGSNLEVIKSSPFFK